MNTNQTEVAAIAAPSLSIEHAAQVKAQAVKLSTADKSFEAAVMAVAEGVARILGTDPSYDHWTMVQASFIADYTEARECKEETSRKRWQAVVSALEGNFALEKPAKPTKAAEIKAQQREGASATAMEMIESAGALTPQSILALSENADAPVAAPVVAALAKIAGEKAKEAGKAANDAARAETKTLRDDIRKGMTNLSLAQLREVAALVASYQPAATVPDVETSDEEVTAD